MDETEKRLKRDQASTDIVTHDRNRLIESGCYPAQFHLPITIQFELTSKCNLHCKHCYNRSGETSSSDAMSPDHWISFCKGLVAKGGILQATISGGEPLLLREKLWEIMDVLHADNTLFNFISNGYLFDQNVLRHLVQYSFYWVQISLDSYQAKAHDQFRGIAGSWERAARAAYAIALAGIPLRVASTVTPQDMEHLEDFVQMAINLGASYFVIGEVMPSGRSFEHEEIFLSREDRNFFFVEMERLSKKHKEQLSILVSGSSKTQLDYASRSTIDGAIIRPNGDIRLDCNCPFVIGNVLKDDIETVWREKADCWKHPSVQKYIDSCDPISGWNTFRKNYAEDDIYL